MYYLLFLMTSVRKVRNLTLIVIKYNQITFALVKNIKLMNIKPIRRIQLKRQQEEYQDKKSKKKKNESFRGSETENGKSKIKLKYKQIVLSIFIKITTQIIELNVKCVGELTNHHHQQHQTAGEERKSSLSSCITLLGTTLTA